MVQPKDLPQRPGDTGPNIVEFALATTHAPGVQMYKRSGMSLRGADSSCAKSVSYTHLDVYKRQVLARAGNRTRELADPTAHAEMLVIRAACRALGSERLVGCDLYVTLEPCPMCAAAISLARIRRLYYGASDPKGGGVEHGPRIFTQPTCNHRPDVYGGIGEDEAGGLLRSFFAARRAP